MLLLYWDPQLKMHKLFLEKKSFKKLVKSAIILMISTLDRMEQISLYETCDKN